MTTLLNQDGPRRCGMTETNTPGLTRDATHFMAERSLETHGAFIRPWLHPGLRVLDCGCGPGTITHGLANAVFPGQVTGIDRSETQIEQAQRLSFGLEQINAGFQTADVYRLPFENGSFDLVFAHALFEHLARPLEALRELHRVLRPGGIIGLCSPDWDTFFLEPWTQAEELAVQTYRRLQEQNGGDTAAGCKLGSWLVQSGFVIEEEQLRFETYEDAGRITGYLALKLGQSGHPIHAGTLLTWREHPDALFSQAWNSVVARKD